MMPVGWHQLPEGLGQNQGHMFTCWATYDQVKAFIDRDERAESINQRQVGT